MTSRRNHWQKYDSPVCDSWMTLFNNERLRWVTFTQLINSSLPTISDTLSMMLLKFYTGMQMCERLGVQAWRLTGVRADRQPGGQAGEQDGRVSRQTGGLMYVLCDHGIESQTICTSSQWHNHEAIKVPLTMETVMLMGQLTCNKPMHLAIK